MPQLAQAKRQVQGPHGDPVEAHEFQIPLSVVSLRGSVPDDWVLDYRRACGNLVGVSLDQRSQLQDIFDELSNPGCAS